MFEQHLLRSSCIRHIYIINPRFILSGAHGIDGGFVSQTCWIQGVYVYRELQDRIDDVAYFGIPKDIALDGFLDNTDNKELCQLEPKLGKMPSENCKPMHKTFFLQVRTGTRFAVQFILAS